MRKGWGQVVAALGILQAGGAYLPIGRELPEERRLDLILRGGVRRVVVRSADAEGPWPAGVDVVAIDDLGVLAEPVRGPTALHRLAYVIFTSGSTGVPKGVAIEHRAAVNTVLDVNERFGVGPADRVFGVSSLSFDLSVWDVFGVLGAGGTLVLPEPGTERDPGRWARWMRDEGVTIWNSVPALLSMLVAHAGERTDVVPETLRLALLSGDWIPLALPDATRRIAPGCEVVSLGGATEASIWSIHHRILEVDPRWTSIPYGRPLANQTLRVLDARLAERPDGVTGDLYIGGAGLAREYLGDPEKTAASFVTDPRTGERLYRTGDLGRYLPSGEIEFLGREDFQVKVGGLRLEVG